MNEPNLYNPTITFNCNSSGSTRWELRMSGDAADTLAFVYYEGNVKKTFFNVAGNTGLYGQYYNELGFTKSSIVKDGNIWATGYNGITIISIMCQVNSNLSEWTNYSLGNLRSCVSTYNVRGMCVDQETGVSYILSCESGTDKLNLSIKGKPLSLNHWIWGQLVCITNLK